MNKKTLRQQYLEKRRQLTDEAYRLLNEQLLKQFQQINLSGINCLHLFLSIKERKEPDTGPIRQWLKLNQPQIRIALPKTDFKTLSMQSFADDAHLQLAVNKYGFNEPASGNEIAPETIDMILMPLLAFDERGYRVGYGKGFYDRFVQLCKPGIPLIGLSFFDPVDAIDDINQFDAPMSGCITPGRYWRW